MKLSYNWLNDYITLPKDVRETADTLTLIGLEEEETITVGTNLDGIITGEILNIEKHPNADRLSVCTVYNGTDELSIVCGASNVEPGQKVAVAPINSQLPIKDEKGRPIVIKKTKLRGVVSEGMICAENELGLSQDHSGIMVLPKDTPVGVPLSTVMHSYEDDIIEIAITPNRPDATSHIGVARDLSAKWNKPLKVPSISKPSNLLTQGNTISIHIDDTSGCHRYVGILIDNITIEASPKWLSQRLEAIGLRSINNIVDITNYVMFEMGQPLHAFDANGINGNQIRVKSFETAMPFTTLDEIKREVPANSLFICDAQQPIAIAGVMGGENSEVNNQTTKILLESAYFDPGRIRKCAKDLALQTDASYRFERGIDPEMTLRAGMRAADLIQELLPSSTVVEIIDVHPVKWQPISVSLSAANIHKILGVEISPTWMSKTLTDLGIGVTELGNDTWTCTIPSFRPDLEREIDLIEEIGRIYDYNNIPSPSQGIRISTEPFSEWEICKQKIIDRVVGLGFNEIYSNSLISEEEASHFGDLKNMIATLNPLTKDMTTLRPSLLAGFLKAASYNKNRQASGVRFFELGNVFTADSKGTYHKGIGEQTHILLGVSGFKHEDHWLAKSSPFSFMDLKADIQALFISLGLERHIQTKVSSEQELEYFLEGEYLGKLSKVNNTLQKTYELDAHVFYGEFNVNTLYEAFRNQGTVSFNPIPKFPGIEYDIALIVDQEIHAETLRQEISSQTGPLLEKIDIFDVYEGEHIAQNSKSIAFRLAFIDANKTLNIKDIEPIINNVVRSLNKKYNVVLRS